MKQIALKQIKGIIRIKTGLHIGSGNDKIEIGGMDNPIIRNPLTREPYIPGSSIKGKMRSLIEWKEGILTESRGYPCNCGKADCVICRVFGSANTDENRSEQRGPTRIIVRDATLTEESKKHFYAGDPIVEEKYENSLNRITAKANPRPIERIVPDTTFDFSIAYRIIDTGDNGVIDSKYFNNVVLTGLKMLEKDYLGGGGSRGNGKILFENLIDESGNIIKLPEL